MTELVEINFTTEQLLSLPREKKDFVLVASFIVNDIRFHWAFQARSPIDSENKSLNRMQRIRHLWGIRKLASVIVEADDAIGKLIGKCSTAKNVSRSFPPISRQNRAGKWMKTARQLRTQTSYHYLSQDLGVYLPNFEPTENHRHYAHVQQGNSICTIGEQVFTAPLILNELGSTGLNEFARWTEECSNSILDFCNRVLAEIVSENLPDQAFQTLQIDDLEESDSSRRWSLFLKV